MARRKKSPLQRAKDKAWSAFSKYIRLRDADIDGVCRCVTCGQEKPWKKIQAGHFIPGRTNRVLFDEKCVHAQCFVCNVRLGGNMIRYWLWMEKTYGRPWIDALIETMDEPLVYGIEDYVGLANRYEKLAKELLSQKSI